MVLQTKSLSLAEFKQYAVPPFYIVQLTTSGSMVLDYRSQSFFINDVFNSIAGISYPFTSTFNYTGSSVIVSAANTNTTLLGKQAGLRNYITSISVVSVGTGSILGGGIVATVWNSGSVLWQAALTGSQLFASQSFPSPLPSIWMNSIISGSIGATANVVFNISGFVA